MENNNYIVNFVNAVTRDSSVRFMAPVCLKILKGENVAIVGDNGAGKTILVDMITGRYPLCSGVVEYDFSPSLSSAVYKNVRVVSFRDIYGSSESDYCYQLRWNVHEQDEIPTVADVLGEKVYALLNNKGGALLGIEHMLEKKVVMLSSGELRKLHIAMAVADNPRLLILDNPFIGLDEMSRKVLKEQLYLLSLSGILQIVLVLSSFDDMPSFVDSVVVVKNRCIAGKYSRKDFFDKLYEDGDKKVKSSSFKLSELQNRIMTLPYKEGVCSGDEMLSLNNVSVAYGSRVILKNITWKVCAGEVWGFEGANGSGKSTLLSLVCADNLQSYACDMSLFGRKRGTGESIWDIKKRIGYVSPEMHRSYLRNLPVGDIVASGLFDSIGLYRKATEMQREQCSFWLDIFGISELANSSFLRVSSGEQRLALLARAFVKNPDLLILDEPFHGLDMYNKQKAKAVVEAFSRIEGKSVIFVSHYKEEFPCTVTRRIRLDGGRLIDCI